MILHSAINITNAMLFPTGGYEGESKDIIIEANTEGWLEEYIPQQQHGLHLQIFFSGQNRPWLVSREWIREDIDKEELIRPRIKRLLAVLRNPDPTGDPNMVEIRNFDDLSGKAWMDSHLRKYGALHQNQEDDKTDERLQMALRIAKKMEVDDDHMQEIEQLKFERDSIPFTKFDFYIYNSYNIEDVVRYIESYRQEDIPFID